MDIMITFVKRLQLSRLLVIFLAGIVLLVSIACSQSPSDKLSKTEAPGYVNKDNVVLKAVKDSYKTVPPEGGMNNHRDVDRRQNTKYTDAKAQNLINRANNNLKDRARNPAEAIENLKSDAPIDKIKDKFEDVSKNVLDSTKEAKKGANRGFENLKTNIKLTSDSVADKVEQAIQ